MKRCFKAKGDEIRRLREGKHLEQQALADRPPRISIRSLRNAENGERLSLPALYRIATKLSIHVGSIIEDGELLNENEAVQITFPRRDATSLYDLALFCSHIVMQRDLRLDLATGEINLIDDLTELLESITTHWGILVGADTTVPAGPYISKLRDVLEDLRR